MLLADFSGVFTSRDAAMFNIERDADVTVDDGVDVNVEIVGGLTGCNGRRVEEKTTFQDLVSCIIRKIRRIGMY